MAVLFSILVIPEAEAAEAGASEAYPVAIELVRPGREGLELTARLTEDSPILERNLSWTVSSADGKPILMSEGGGVDVSVPPGDYLVDAQYGAAKISRIVSLPQAGRMMVSLVMNAGGLRVVARGSDKAPPSSPVHVRVFSLEGNEPGRLIASNAGTGEIIRLPQGTYRVEARAGRGNAAAVTDVEVKPGRLSTIRVALKAGLARLSFVGSPTAQVRWNVEDENGDAVAVQSGLTADVALLPGTYTAKAEVGSERLTATFRIAAGEARDIMLGN